MNSQENWTDRCLNFEDTTLDHHLNHMIDPSIYNAIYFSHLPQESIKYSDRCASSVFIRQISNSDHQNFKFSQYFNSYQVNVRAEIIRSGLVVTVIYLTIKITGFCLFFSSLIYYISQKFLRKGLSNSNTRDRRRI